MFFTKCLILAFAAAAANALSNDLAVYPECADDHVVSHLLGEGTMSHTVIWRHPRGTSSLSNGSEISCTFDDNKLDTFRTTANIRRSLSRRSDAILGERGCADCDEACWHQPCDSGAGCVDAGCLQGCSTVYECAPESCPGLSTACI